MKTNSVNSQGPLRVNKANPRYFTNDTGKAIYLTGSHTWNNFQDKVTANTKEPIDYNTHLDFLTNHHHNFTRMWLWENAKGASFTVDDIHFSPLPYERTGSGIALDGEPKFDLTRFNEDFFNRLRSRIIAAGERGIYIAIMLFNGWCVDRKELEGNPWPGHPFNIHNNINNIDGDPDNSGEGKDVHTLKNSAITRLQEAYVKKIIDTLNDLDNVIYEISNEDHKDSIEWQFYIDSYIRNYEKEKPKQHPIIYSVPWGEFTKIWESPSEAVSPGLDKITGYFYKDNPPLNDGNKIIITDTDHLWGEGGDRQWVWKSFLRGLNPIFMDNLEQSDWRESCRNAMGDTLRYAEKINLTEMVPLNAVSSTNCCLADLGSEYLTYQPVSESFTLNLKGTSGVFTVEWFNPSTRETIKGCIVNGGNITKFSPPFDGDAVLYLKSNSIA